MNKKKLTLLIALSILIAYLVGPIVVVAYDFSMVEEIETTVIEEPKTTIEETPEIVIEEEPTPALLPLDDIAKEIIAGKWGNGEERKQSLINAGYNYEEVQKKVEELSPKQVTITSTPISPWNGNRLTKRGGTCNGPNGKETYYNLSMGGVVQIMRNHGFSEAEYPYWVRSDGCKMLGNYIMVAADLSLRPRGSLVETSLGTGLVCDTGGFAIKNPTQLDIAVNW